MPAYVISEVEPRDAAQFERYRAMAPDTIKRYGGRYIVRAGAAELVEGGPPPKTLIIVEFPDMARAREWYRPLARICRGAEGAGGRARAAARLRRGCRDAGGVARPSAPRRAMRWQPRPAMRRPPHGRLVRRAFDPFENPGAKAQHRDQQHHA